MKRFQRTIENFTCEHCSSEVVGNGYTNHCPHCLYSKHVDINPGDRAAGCAALMRPVAVTVKSDHYIITHRCESCGFERRQRSAPEDNFEQLLKIAQGEADS